MKKILSIVKNIDYYSQPVFFILMIFGVALQVGYRYIPNLSVPWSLEFVSFTFSASVWLGLSIGIKEDAHVGITFFVDKMSKNGQKICRIIQFVIFFLFILSIFVLGSKALIYYFNKNSLTPGMRVPYFIVRFPLVIGSICCFFRIFQKLRLIIKK